MNILDKILKFCKIRYLKNLVSFCARNNFDTMSESPFLQDVLYCMNCFKKVLPLLLPQGLFDLLFCFEYLVRCNKI